MTSRLRTCGFTLVEMIMVIVILGVISAALAVFIRSPVEGYIDAVRRAELVDVADTALRRLGRDLRRAVPNSARVTGTCDGAANCYIEFLPTTNGGRYRAAGETDLQCAVGGTAPLHDTLYFTPDTDSCFEILGPPITFTAGDQIVIANWGNPGSNAYEGNSSSTHVLRPYAGGAGAAVSKVVMTTPAGTSLPLESPSKRFQVISGAEPAVSYACEGISTNASGDGMGTLKRYWGYVIASAQPTSFVNSYALIAENVSACKIVYGTLGATNPYTRNDVVAIVLGITRANETVNLYHEIHVDNLP